ncbi:ZMAT1 protein, partial [Bucco capensis]|nr:ZMAT1 protein [Bucco capensis]
DDILDEATRKDLFTKTFCKLCKAVLQCESQRTSHYEGKKHAQKVRLYIQMHGKKDERQQCGKQKKTHCVNFQRSRRRVVDKYRYCNPGNVFLASPVDALYHHLGKIHTKKLKQLSGKQACMQPVSAEESSASSNTRLELDADKYCKLCCAPFSNSLVSLEHYSGKRHKKNEARKKILEELGDKGVPAEFSTNGFFFSAVGVGYYMCHVCNVVLTSIETYQSHMQGNKHWTKERGLVNPRKKSKKRRNSFQNKLTDDIEVQKAGGLEPRKWLEKAEEKEFQDKNTEGGSSIGEVISSNFKCEQGQHSSLFSETRSPTNTGESRSPNWPSASECALENTPNSCYKELLLCKEEQPSEVAIVTPKSLSPAVAESKNYCKHMLAENSKSFYRKEQKFQIEPFEEEKYISEELKYDKEATKQKRKKISEGADFDKENEKRKRMKV